MIFGLQSAASLSHVILKFRRLRQVQDRGASSIEGPCLDREELPHDALAELETRVKEQIELGVKGLCW